MNDSGESIDQRKAHLAATIARQRGEFAVAYRNIATPIHYTEQAMRGFGFLRSNPWVLTVVPAIFSVTGTLIGIVRNKPPKSASRQRQRTEERERPKSLLGHAAKWGGHGWRAYKVYRRFRHYFSP